MNNLKIGDEVIPVRRDDPHYGQIGVVASIMLDSNRCAVDFGNSRRIRDFNVIKKAGETMEQKTMNTNEVARLVWTCADKGFSLEKTFEYFNGLSVNKELVEELYDECVSFGFVDFIEKYGLNSSPLIAATDIANIVENTNAIIQIDVKTAIEYIDSQVLNWTGDPEELENKLKKWFKRLAEKRLELTNPVRDSLQQVVNDEKKIEAHLAKIFAANKAKRDAEEAARKKAKYAEVMAIMADMLNTVDLPAEYRAKIVFREEYYQKTMVNKKLKDSIQEQIDTQVNLYNGWKAEQELKQQKIKNRELLIANLNAQYNANGTYSMFTIETHTDEQVAAKYETNHQLKLKQEMERQDAEKQKNTPTQTDVVQSPQVNAQGGSLRMGWSTSTGNQADTTPMDVSSNQEQKQNDTNPATSCGSVKTYRFSIDASQCTDFSENDCWHNFVKRLDAFKENFAKYGVKMIFEEINNA